MKFLPGSERIVHAVVYLVVSAAAIFSSGSILKGMTVKGYTGALVAAVGIALVNFVLLFVVLGGRRLRPTLDPGVGVRAQVPACNDSVRRWHRDAEAREGELNCIGVCF